MIAARAPGLIVNLSSVVRPGNPGQSAYAATKAAIASLTVTWTRELAAYRIRVAALSPGFVETGMTRNIPPIFLERIEKESPVGRFGRLDELADGLRFIIENDYFSGRVLDLDGGLRF
jgi:3-oxoacyl-[acyl-carrier protein] reductase